METFDIMDACKASAKDFCETLLFCLENDGIFTKEDGSLDEDYKKEYKEYLDGVLEMHYNTDIGEQGENIEKYLDECGFYDFEEMFLNEQYNIEKWLKENNYTDRCVDRGFGHFKGYLARSMDFKYNGDTGDLDADKLAASISKNISEKFCVSVSKYDDEENLFCVDIIMFK